MRITTLGLALHLATAYGLALPWGIVGAASANEEVATAHDQTVQGTQNGGTLFSAIDQRDGTAASRQSSFLEQLVQKLPWNTEEKDRARTFLQQKLAQGAAEAQHGAKVRRVELEVGEGQAQEQGQQQESQDESQHQDQGQAADQYYAGDEQQWNQEQLDWEAEQQAEQKEGLRQSGLLFGEKMADEARLIKKERMESEQGELQDHGEQQERGDGSIWMQGGNVDSDMAEPNMAEEARLT